MSENYSKGEHVVYVERIAPFGPVCIGLMVGLYLIDKVVDRHLICTDTFGNTKTINLLLDSTYIIKWDGNSSPYIGVGLVKIW